MESSVSSDLSFVSKCLASKAISRDELSQWAARAIDSEDNSPLYLYDMLDYRANRYDLFKLFGFVPVSGLSEIETKYLHQIAARRNRKIYHEYESYLDIEITEDRKQYIHQWFKDMFGIDVDVLPPLADIRDMIEIDKPDYL